MNKAIETDKEVWWSKLYPKEWLERLEQAPIVYLPLGICEPHGQVSAFGLDLIKAEAICEDTARKAGGIVAPSLGYQIHESGYHARWLEEQIGEVNGRMTGMPPHIMLYFFFYQLRAFVNAGFKGIVVLSGHGGGNQKDYRLAADWFMKHVPVRIWVGTDGDLVNGLYRADHAGQFEISQLMHLDPALIDLSRTELENQPGSGGKFARADDALHASPELGQEIMEACTEALSAIVKKELLDGLKEQPAAPPITYDFIEGLWQTFHATRFEWESARPREAQSPVSPNSQWKPYEYPYSGSGS
jgi:creatinine amidohydrolase